MSTRNSFDVLCTAIRQHEDADTIMAPLVRLLNPLVLGTATAAEIAARLETAEDTLLVRQLWADAVGERRTAYHEAGHALGGAVVGLRFDRVSIEPIDADRSLGHVQFADLALRPIRNREHAEAIAVMQVAGPLAERAGALGPSPEAMDQHREYADNALALGLPTWSVTARGHLRAACEASAWELVGTHRRWLERVVGELLAKRTLTEAAVFALSADPIALQAA